MAVQQERGAAATYPIFWVSISVASGLLVIGLMWADQYMVQSWGLLWFGATTWVGLLLLTVNVYGFYRVMMAVRSGTDTGRLRER